MRLRRAVLLVPFLLAVACAFTSAAERWTMVRSQSITVIGDQSPGTLRDVAERIETFRAGIGTLIPNAQGPAAMPTVVFVFGTRKAMQPFLPLRKDGKPASLGGYFQRDEDVNYIALTLEGFDDNLPVVFHEYTHLLVRNAVRNVPVWLNEGLAEYYSTFSVSAGGARAEAGRPVIPHVQLLRRRFLPVSELIAVDASSELYDEGVRRSIFYAESWALTHYLMVDMPGGPAAINRYVNEVGAGRRPADAFFDAFGKTPQKFEEQLRKYVDHPMFQSRSYDLPVRVHVDVPDEGRTLTAGEAGAWLGDLQRRVRRKTEAGARIEAAVRLDPQAAITHLALGLLRIDEGRTSEAWPALERAVGLAPDDFMAQYAYGVSLLREVAQVDGMMADALALERSLAALRRATVINPDASDAWAWLAYGDMLDEHNLTDADLAITTAIRLSPGRLDYRLRRADISILRGRVEEARKVLTELAAVTSDRAIAERADRRLAVLNDRTAQRQMRDSAALTPAKEAVARSVDVGGDGTIRSDGVPREDDPAPRFKLREPMAFEDRAYGLLTLLECGSDEVRFHVKTADRTVVATAARMEDVELTSFTDIKNFAVACGARTPPDTVYLTWHIAEQQRRLGTAVVVGEAVALEFVPRDHVPRR